MNKIIFYCSLLISFQVFAFENTGAPSMASGGAGAGVLEEVDGTYLNPASIALFQKKSFAASFSKYHTNIHMTDNGRDAFFPAALAYTKTDENQIQTQAYHLVIAYPILPNLSLGSDLSMREIKFETATQKFRQTIVSPAICYLFSEAFSAGLVWKNKALTDTDLNDIIDLNSTVVFGLGYVYDKFAKIRADIETAEHEKTDKMIYKFGIETYLNDWIITRIGYQNNNAHSLNFFTAGVGFAGPQFGLHYAYQSEARNIRDPLHTIDLNIPF
jgi:hypothetical protein